MAGKMYTQAVSEEMTAQTVKPMAQMADQIYVKIRKVCKSLARCGFGLHRQESVQKSGEMWMYTSLEKCAITPIHMCPSHDDGARAEVKRPSCDSLSSSCSSSSAGSNEKGRVRFHVRREGFSLKGQPELDSISALPNRVRQMQRQLMVL
jgi:hypothetical protein